MSEDLFKTRKPVVGVIHVGARPGTPASTHGVDELTELAVREAMRTLGAGERTRVRGASEPAGTNLP